MSYSATFYRAIYFALFSMLFILTPAATGVNIVPKRVVDIVSITWPGSISNFDVRDVETSLTQVAINKWTRLGNLTSSTQNNSIQFVHGFTSVRPVNLVQKLDCAAEDFSNLMVRLRQEAYRLMEIKEFSERYLVMLLPKAGCIWSGRALIGDMKTLGGVIMLHDTDSPFVLAHELGHAIGLGHSNFLSCTSAASDGPWGRDCNAIEYGGAIDLMSNVDVDTPLSSYHQWRLGLLGLNEIRQSWLSEKVTLSAVDINEGYRAIFLRDGQSTYWVEYRRADIEANYKPGLVIYRSDPPPISSIISPNPEDTKNAILNENVTSDIWLLNWDNFTYVNGRTSGSMTLPEGRTAKLHSGNIRLRAVATNNPNQVEVIIERTPDDTPPPTPKLTNSTTWRNPFSSIIEQGYQDYESDIDYFEAEVSGTIYHLPQSKVENFIPTFLRPFQPPPTVYVKDLPEGKYTISIRAVDVWGNKSPWSDRTETIIDRENPIVGNEFTALNYVDDRLSVAWSETVDKGVGLCETNLYNEDGFITQNSPMAASPIFTMNVGLKYEFGAQVFDCLGNGMEGQIRFESKIVPPSKSKRTGNWSQSRDSSGRELLSCSGRCTASFSINGQVQALIGKGNLKIQSIGKESVQVTGPKTSGSQLTDVIDVGQRKKVIRVSGRDFAFFGLLSLNTYIGKFGPVRRLPETVDLTLEDGIQSQLAKLGFRASDFIQDWSIQPMNGGTTLLDPTLDLCSTSYVSNSRREARRQVLATKIDSPYTFLSTEVVKYQSASDAKFAIDELREKISTCMKIGGYYENGTFVPYSFQELPSTKAKLVDLNNLVKVRTRISTGTGAQQLLAIYQFNESYLTGLYVVVAGEPPIPDDEVVRWLEVAEVLAQRIQSK